MADDPMVEVVKDWQAEMLNAFEVSNVVGAIVLIAWVAPDGRGLDVLVQHSVRFEEAGPLLAERARQALVRYQQDEFDGRTGLPS